MSSSTFCMPSSLGIFSPSCGCFLRVFAFIDFGSATSEGCGSSSLWRLLLRGHGEALAFGTHTEIAGMDQLSRFESDGAVKVEVERVECGAMEAGRRSGDDGILESSSSKTFHRHHRHHRQFDDSLLKTPDIALPGYFEGSSATSANNPD